jgi:hypothetical protein
MGAVAEFRGLKHSLGFVVIPARREEGLTLIAERTLGKLFNEKFKDARIVLLGTLAAPGRACSLFGSGAPLAWGRLAEQLSAANPRLELRLRTKTGAGTAQEHFERAFAAASDLEFPVLVVQKMEARAAEEPVDLEALRERTALVLGALYRLTTGSAEVKYDPITVVATPAKKSAYLGTKPEYQGDGTGVVLAGVTPGSPADAAGVKVGDKVVNLGGAEVKDPESYLRALEKLTPGEKSSIEVQREGKALTLDIVPGTK